MSRPERCCTCPTGDVLCQYEGQETGRKRCRSLRAEQAAYGQGRADEWAAVQEVIDAAKGGE